VEAALDHFSHSAAETRVRSNISRCLSEFAFLLESLFRTLFRT
jgi:hypothetical protein